MHGAPPYNWIGFRGGGFCLTGESFSSESYKAAVFPPLQLQITLGELLQPVLTSCYGPLKCNAYRACLCCALCRLSLGLHPLRSSVGRRCLWYVVPLKSHTVPSCSTKKQHWMYFSVNQLASASVSKPVTEATARKQTTTVSATTRPTLIALWAASGTPAQATLLRLRKLAESSVSPLCVAPSF